MKQEDFERELYAKSRMNSLQSGWEKKDRMRGSIQLRNIWRYVFIYGLRPLIRQYVRVLHQRSNRLRHPNGIWFALEKVELKNVRLVLCWEITLAS